MSDPSEQLDHIGHVILPDVLILTAKQNWYNNHMRRSGRRVRFLKSTSLAATR